MRTKSLIIIAAVVASILLIPLIAMQFTKEVDWDLFDFFGMGVLMFGTGVLIEIVLITFKTPLSRTLACGFVLLAFILVWLEVAVGVFGSPFAGS